MESPLFKNLGGLVLTPSLSFENGMDWRSHRPFTLHWLIHYGLVLTPSIFLAFFGAEPSRLKLSLAQGASKFFGGLFWFP